MTWFWLGGSTKGTAAEDSKELLKQLRFVANRPDQDRDLTDAKGYLYLTQAQTQLLYRIAAHIPEVMKGAPEKMVTSDGGLTYTTSAEPLGHIEVYPAPFAEPLIEGPFWDSRADYVREGTKKIRMSGNRPRTFGDGPYARYIKKPGVIDDVSQPTLEPTDIRRVLPWMAAAMWAEAGGIHDPSPYRRMTEILLWGDPAVPGDVGVIGAYKLQHFGGGGMSATHGLDLWTRSPDLGRIG